MKHHIIRYHRILNIPVASSSLSFPHQTVYQAKAEPFPMSIHRCQLPRLASLRYMLPRLRYYLTTVRPIRRLFSYPEKWCRRETNSTKDAFSRTYQWANGKPNLMQHVPCNLRLSFRPCNLRLSFRLYGYRSKLDSGPVGLNRWRPCHQFQSSKEHDFCGQLAPQHPVKYSTSGHFWVSSSWFITRINMHKL